MYGVANTASYSHKKHPSRFSTSPLTVRCERPLSASVSMARCSCHDTSIQNSDRLFPDHYHLASIISHLHSVCLSTIDQDMHGARVLVTSLGNSSTMHVRNMTTHDDELFVFVNPH